MTKILTLKRDYKLCKFYVWCYFCVSVPRPPFRSTCPGIIPEIVDKRRRKTG